MYYICNHGLFFVAKFLVYIVQGCELLVQGKDHIGRYPVWEEYKIKLEYKKNIKILIRSHKKNAFECH